MPLPQTEVCRPPEASECERTGRPGWRMAALWKVLAGGLLLLGLQVEGQGNGRGKKEVSGDSTLNLGQHRDLWRPMIHTAANLSEINRAGLTEAVRPILMDGLFLTDESGIFADEKEDVARVRKHSMDLQYKYTPLPPLLVIKSSFQLRTFDPEGTIFYGDTKNGGDWFVLALKDGIPLMQISKEDVLVSVAGGPKLNDGKWHTLDVSNQGKFVVLDVDGSTGLVVGMQSDKIEDVIFGKLRLAVGGILINKEKMMVQFEPQMDGCVRGGSWLNLSIPWELETDELGSCHPHIQAGSYFPGTGFAVFNTSVFSFEEERGLKIELRGDFSQMDGTILSIRTPQGEPTFTVAATKSTKELTLTFKEKKVILTSHLKKLVITSQTDSLKGFADTDEPKRPAFSISTVEHPGYLAAWRDGCLAVGGLLADCSDDVGSQFLTGCLEKIKVQEIDLDLDLSIKHKSISSHSCPAS